MKLYKEYEQTEWRGKSCVDSVCERCNKHRGAHESTYGLCPIKNGERPFYDIIGNRIWGTFSATNTFLFNGHSIISPNTLCMNAYCTKQKDGNKQYCSRTCWKIDAANNYTNKNKRSGYPENRKILKSKIQKISDYNPKPFYFQKDWADDTENL